MEFTKTTDDVAFSGQRRAYKRASILPALIKTFGGWFLLGVFLKFINDTLQFVNPQILRWVYAESVMVRMVSLGFVLVRLRWLLGCHSIF